MPPPGDALAPGESSEGHWVPLPANGWGALVAYLAPSGTARAIPRADPDAPDDVALYERYVRTYLAEHGVPAVPEGVAFELRLPEGVEYAAVESELNVAVLREAADGDPAAEREAMRRVLRRVLA